MKTLRQFTSRLRALLAMSVGILLVAPALAQVSQNLGTLAPGESVTITFEVLIDSPLSVAVTQLSAQGTVTYDGGSTLDTDDPETVAASDATLTALDQDFDFGDAPDPTYPTRQANDGARHFLPAGGATLYLGAVAPDAEPDGQPDASATGDGADEDGVTLPVSLAGGLNAEVTVTVSGDGNLSAWVDWNQDGDWNDADEQIFTDLVLSAAGSPHTLNVLVPGSVSSGTTFARFRFSTDSGLAPTGVASDGEVEDYAVTLTANTPPVAGDDALETREGEVAVVVTVKLLINDTDADADALSVTAVNTPSTAGGTVSLLGSEVSYTPPGGGFSGPDSFTYTVSDGRGGAASGTVQVTVRDADGIGDNPAQIEELGGSYRIRFAGIPGEEYQVQWSDQVDGPWNDLGAPVTANLLGVVEAIDATATPPNTRFYRMIPAP